MVKYFLVSLSILIQVNIFSQHVSVEESLQKMLSKLAAAKFENFKTYAAALKKDSSAYLLVSKDVAYEHLNSIKHSKNEAYRYAAFFDVKFNKADFNASSLERILNSIGREKFFARQIPSLDNDSLELRFVMEEKNSDYYNLSVDEYRFKLKYYYEEQIHRCDVEIHVTNLKDYVPFYHEDYFTTKLKPLVANNQFSTSSYKKNKDGDYIVFSGRNDKDYIKIQVEKDDATKNKTNILTGTFTYVLDKNQKFLLPNFRSLVQNCFNENTADLLVDTDDIPTDTTKFDGAFGKVIQLTSNGFLITRNTIVATIVEPDDGINEYALLNIRFNFYSNANDATNAKKYYWAKTKNEVNESFKNYIQLICNETKKKSVYNEVKNEQELTDTVLIEAANSDFNLRYFTKASIPDFNILKADETNHIYLIKKLSGNTEEDDVFIQPFLLQLGNALPQNFVFDSKFYKEYFNSKSTNPTIKINPNKYVYVFNEMYNYKFDKENLLKISVQRRLVTNNNSREETYLVVIFEKGS